MIIPVTCDYPALMFTIVQCPNGRFVKVGMTEEELFRAVLGDEEFERRRDEENQRIERQAISTLSNEGGKLELTPLHRGFYE